MSSQSVSPAPANGNAFRGMPQVLKRIAARYHDDPLQLLQMLRAVQASYSYVPHEAITYLAQHLQVPLAQVQGVVEFYSFLHLTPRGRYDIYFSDSITDHMLGSRELAFRLANHLGLVPGEPRADGQVTVDFTSCTGMCDQGPAGLVNGLAITHLTPARVDEMADLIEAGIAPEAWPREWFSVRDNIRRCGVIFSTTMTRGQALHAAMQRGAEAMLRELDVANLRGRGGAGFKTAQKWRYCREAKGDQRYVVCNADEGEPGTFKDRVLLTRLADQLFEGMTLAGYVVGSNHGFLYLRGEYQYLIPHLEGLLARRRETGLLGNNIQGSGFKFDISIHLGAGAYICGEESALIESLEGKRGQARVRPPFPVVRGYAQKPTTVNNVQTFIQAAQIAVMGGNWFAGQGTEQSRGTVLLSVCGDVARPGIYEYPFGVSVAEVLADCGAEHVQGLQVGGPSGHTIGVEDLQRKICFEDLSTTGSFIVFDVTRDMTEVAQNFTRFFQHESCGFCTPCRVGTMVLRELVDKVCSGRATQADLDEIRGTAEVTRNLSHCGLGQTAANPLIDTLLRFPASYTRKLVAGDGNPGFDLDAELADARKLSGRDDLAAHGLETHHD